MDKASRWLASTLDYRFDDPALFAQALTHRSASGASNERLEFLGDAVLDFVVSEIVYAAMPAADEGDLSRLRSSLVKDSSLAGLAADIGLGEHLILGGGERKSGGHRRKSILADTLEALFGAVYLDAGYSAAKAIIARTFGDRLVNLPDPRELRDPKTRLQEWLQARHLPLPDYELIEISGEAHKQRFEIRCSVDGVESAARGKSSSRRRAEQKAAERMLSELARAEQ
ncbi:MAG: ribonuclease III [Gammaproteobacteria bacterium]|nr:ribonuclease III [Gammaproteobacteria bacterium]